MRLPDLLAYAGKILSPGFIHWDPLCELQFGDEVIEQNVVTEIFIHDNTHTSLVIMLDKKHDCSCKVVVVHERGGYKDASLLWKYFI